MCGFIRRCYWLVFIFLLGISTQAQEVPNVLFVAVDDMRCDAACYGHAEAITPNIDRLAKAGVLFRRAYCQQALCNPSRASLLTGLRPDTLGIWNLTTGFREADRRLVTLPELFRNNGYHTQGIGKIFHNWRTKLKGDPQSWSVPATYHFARHDDDKPQHDRALPEDRATAPRCMCLDVPDEAYFDGRIAADAVSALRDRAADQKKFFLAVGFWKPHLPFNPPRRYWDMYSRRSIQLPTHRRRPADAPGIAFHDSREILRATDGNLTQSEVRELRHGYLAGISFLDAQLGKLLDELERTGLRKNTIVVFWSDHGFHLGEKGLWCKTSNFERDARVPLIISDPAMPSAGSKTSALVELVDIYPTLAELCGISASKDLDGRSLKTLLVDPKPTFKQGAYTQHPRPAYYRDRPTVMGVSVRTDCYRYTEWRDFENDTVQAREVYNYSNDLDESDNLLDRISDSQLRSLQELLCLKFPRKSAE